MKVNKQKMKLIKNDIWKVKEKLINVFGIKCKWEQNKYNGIKENVKTSLLESAPRGIVFIWKLFVMEKIFQVDQNLKMFLF